MTKVKVNFGDVQDFDALPEGVYEAVIEKIEYREPKEAGKAPYLNVEYTVQDEEYQGRKVWEVLSWSPKALFRMRDFFRAAGFEDDEYDLEIDEESNLLLEPDLTGESVELTIENEIYNKKEVNRVVAIEFLSTPEAPAEPVKAKAPKATKATKATAVEDEDDAAPEEEEEQEEAPKKTQRTFRPTTSGAKKAPTRRTFR